MAICFRRVAMATLAAKPPNIVPIMADDLGHLHLGSYGQSETETLNLDPMAAEGTPFAAACAGSAICVP
ncbi:MAG: sulfatase-like hydrolase/transferase [Bryobacterales bacterium]|nr:sulfatase-like hydrolase/transferase [Bryobacterales bacterium]